MPLKTRVRDLAKLLFQPMTRLTGADYVAEHQRYLAGLDAWEDAFLRGDDPGPFPVDRLHPWADPARAEASARASACIRARLRGVIGEHDYLPVMTGADRAECDTMCASIYAAHHDILRGREPAFSFPGWVVHRDRFLGGR